MTYEEVIQKMKEAIAQYEEGAIEATECFNYIATVVVRKLNEQ
jgi:predicted RNase H-like HicB family nuclease